MSRSKFDYARQKLVQARRALMAPHPNGEDECFAYAYNDCADGLKNITEASFQEPEPKEPFRVIKAAIKVAHGGERPDGGLYMEKARKMEPEERQRFSYAVDDLANWMQWERFDNG